MIVLGIESSCDETAIGIVDSDHNVKAHIVNSQIDLHATYGGVVPEIAARAHLSHIDGLVKKALDEAGLTIKDIDGFAATAGPGLIGGLLVGSVAAKTLAAVMQKPYIAVNHLEAHALTARMTDPDLSFPYLVLLVSGGHTQLLLARGLGDYECLGSTRDDALGECFDKAGKLLGLPFPGGPHIEKWAAKCPDIEAACARFPLPPSMVGSEGCDFSFSGLKTAVARHIDNLPEGALEPRDVQDICASLQTTVAMILEDRCRQAANRVFNIIPENSNPPPFVLCGGVAANHVLRAKLEGLTKTVGMAFYAPPVQYCSDNGVMIAWTGLEYLQKGWRDDATFKPRPRWPLNEDLTERFA